MTDSRERRLDLSLISNLPAKAAADHLAHVFLPFGVMNAGRRMIASLIALSNMRANAKSCARRGVTFIGWANDFRNTSFGIRESTLWVKSGHDDANSDVRFTPNGDHRSGHGHCCSIAVIRPPFACSEA
jgi:hypothetical protein